MKLFSKNSSLCDQRRPNLTLQTDGRTDGQTDNLL